MVGNPPYITVKDAALNQAYRQRYSTCHMKYSLVVPFTERFFELALPPLPRHPGEGRGPESSGVTLDSGLRRNDEIGGLGAGFVGIITANSFMKREFGKKLIEEFLPKVDLTHVIDTSGAYIPGHGTPTVILFGRNRRPVAGTMRTVMGIKGEPETPEDPAKGLVWRAIVEQLDRLGSESTFVSVADTPRATFGRHPWSIGGGGAGDLREILNDGAAGRLKSLVGRRRFTVFIGDRVATREIIEMGFASFSGADDFFISSASALRRVGIPVNLQRSIISGGMVRDWCVGGSGSAFVPYDNEQQLAPMEPASTWLRWLWPFRSSLEGIISFNNQTKKDLGEPWWGWYRWVADRYTIPLSITFAFVATHNHFVLDRGGKVFNRSAPVIKLKPGATEDDHLALLGLLNSSTACFWLKQIFHNKGSTVDDRGARQRTDLFEDFFEFTGTGLAKFPLAEPFPTDWMHSPASFPVACPRRSSSPRWKTPFPSPGRGRARVGVGW